MGARHSGREAALQMLFQMEASGGEAEEVVQTFWKSFGVDADPEGPGLRRRGRARRRRRTSSKLDELITAASVNWRMERMARVDRNVLRLGTWELAHREDVPRAVVLDEAVELAKAYGSDESSAFVNGVLNRIAETLGRRDPVRGGEAG